MKTNLKLVLATFLYMLVYYYFLLPPINITAIEFWTFLLSILFFILFIKTINFGVSVINNNFVFRQGSKFNVYLGIGIGVIILLIFIVNIFNSPMFNSKKYANRIVVNKDHSFVNDIKEVDFNKIPLLDKASSQKLGDRKMGEITDLVSQFNVSDLYTQINYNNKIVRVTPLEYAGLIKFFTNQKEGVKGYITVDSVNGESSLVKLDKGMQYLPSAYFFKDLNRKLRLTYPTLNFDTASFEIDEKGHPYWIVPTVKYVGVSMRKEINGVVILDAVTGKTKKYSINNIPSWIDHAFSAELIIEQINNWGSYNQGFLNSIFGQKNVVNTTEGYNYIILNDDVYLYTGVTSVASDESNLGFVLVNLRTKETNYYEVAGAEEYSAMSSAEGLVQEKKYIASFPLLINLNNRPTYLLSLKDNAGLVKMYAFVDVVDYQIVSTSDASLGIDNAAKAYLSKINSKSENKDVLNEKNITIKSITSATIDGNSIYYIIDSENNQYQTTIKNNTNLIPFLKSGDSVKITYYVDEIGIIKKIEK